MNGRRFHYVAGTSNKFWTIFPPAPLPDKDAWGVTVCYGRMGTEGTQYTKFLYSKSAAEQHYVRKIREQVNQGYKEQNAASVYATQSPSSDFSVSKPKTIHAACAHSNLVRQLATGLKWKCASCGSVIEFDKPTTAQPVVTEEVTKQKVRRLMDFSMLRKE